MHFKPSAKSFFGSILWAISPVIITGVVLFLMHKNLIWFHWVIGAVAVIVSFFMIGSAIFVHRVELYIDDQVIATHSPLCDISLRWTDIASGLLRERQNAVTATDRLLIFKGRDKILSYPLSVLDSHDQQTILDFVKKKVNITVKRDSPSI